MMLGSFLSCSPMEMISRTITGERDSDFQHGQLTALDTFRDFDFAVAREQRDGSHLAQVHADGIVGFLERSGREVEFDSLFGCLAVKLLFSRNLVQRGKILIIGIDDFDACCPEGGKQVIQVLGRGS